MKRKKIYSIIGIVVLLGALGIASAEIGSQVGDVIKIIEEYVLGPLKLQPGEIHGGGSVLARDPSFKATFGIEGQYTEGNLEYHDHGAKLDIKSKDIIVVVKTMDGKMASMIGYASINGEGSKSFIVFVEDNGEPGKGDMFEIAVPEIGYLNGGMLTGGNIQIGSD